MRRDARIPFRVNGVAMNFLEMKTEVFRRLNESASSPVFWEDADVEDALNEGLEELSDSTEWYETYSVIGLLSNLQYYDLRTLLSGTFLTPRSVQNQQNSRWMNYCTLRDLDFRTTRQWEAVTGEPEKVFLRGLWWLGTFPRSASDSGYLKFWHTAIPQPLVEDADTPEFPEEFHRALVEYAIYDLLCQDGETRKAMAHWAKYGAIEQSFNLYVQRRMTIDRISNV
jgi:hypothetical protein